MLFEPNLDAGRLFVLHRTGIAKSQRVRINWQSFGFGTLFAEVILPRFSVPPVFGRHTWQGKAARRGIPSRILAEEGINHVRTLHRPRPQGYAVG